MAHIREGNVDNTGNSVLWATTLVNLPANSVNRDLLFGNTTPDAFTTGRTVGMFGVDVTEMGVTNASIVAYTLTFAGSGYAANAAVTVSGNATSNATATTGRITAVNVNTAGSGYTSGALPTVTVAAPGAINIISNTSAGGFSNTNDTFLISTANSKFAVNDKVFYAVPTSNTPLAPLAGNTFYYVQAANTTTIKLALTPGGAAINITDIRNDASPETHTIRGETATAVAVTSGAQHGATHSGWVLRKVGSGGRAGRVTYETLVAMGSMTNAGGDAEDTIFKDA